MKKQAMGSARGKFLSLLYKRVSMAIPTGIEDLNSVLLGGIPNNSIVLISFDNLDTTKLVADLIYGGQKQAALVTTDASPADFKNEKYVFVDAYSEQNGLTPRTTDFPVTGAGYINDMSLNLSEIKSKHDLEAIVVFTLSTLLKENPKDAVYKFINVTKGRVPDGFLALFVNRLETSNQDMAKLKALATLTMELATAEDKLIVTSTRFPLPLKLERDGRTLEAI